jgi:hypothetical protein
MMWGAAAALALLRLVLLGLLLPTAAAQAWLPIEYITNAEAKGFDCHDTHSFKPLESPALCSVFRGVITLKGSAQCDYNVLGCFKAGKAFATLPLACRPTADLTVVAGTQEEVNGKKYVKFIYGATIGVGADGTLTLLDPATSNEQWLLSLEGSSFQASPSNWGRSFLLFGAAAAMLYVGGGVAFGSRQGRGSALRAHPHYGLWLELRSLVSDGVAHAKSQTPEPVGGSARRREGARRSSPKSSSSSSSSKSSRRPNPKVSKPTDALIGMPAAVLRAEVGSASSGRWVHAPT